MARDMFAQIIPGFTSPAGSAAEVTPDDAADLAVPSRALHIGGGGDLVALMDGGQTATFKAEAGALLPIRVRRVLATGTTATGIVALW